MACAICNERKEKRFCPAMHAKICAQCCGEQREVTLDCPSDCPYLQQAREHEKRRAKAPRGRTEAQRIHHRDGPRAHGEDVAQDAADAGGRALVGLDERRMVMRLHLERGHPAVADVDHAGVLARPL